MVLPGTVLANKVLKETKLSGRFVRHYTQARANDRSHKLWGYFTEADGEALVKRLSKLGATNPRVVRTQHWGRDYISGVRFEMPKEESNAG